MAQRYHVIFPDKQPYEIVAYPFDAKKFVPKNETFESHAYAIYVSTDDPVTFTDLAPTMFFAKDFDNTKRILEVSIQAGDDGRDYIVRGRLQCVSGHRYEYEGFFRVRERG